MNSLALTTCQPQHAVCQQALRCTIHAALLGHVSMDVNLAHVDLGIYLRPAQHACMHTCKISHDTRWGGRVILRRSHRTMLQDASYCDFMTVLT